MAIRWHTITVASTRHTELLDISDGVDAACRKAVAGEGLAIVYCPHTTAGILIQEAEPGLLADLEHWLSKTVASEESYRHDRVDDNAASHLRAVIAGVSIVVPLRGGALGLGTWQRILFVELDGPRKREVHVGLIA